MRAGLRRLPSLNGLRVFEVAARHQSFRAAAEELGVTQAAVAQQVRGLEAELGLKFFDRGGRSLELTMAGRTYAAEVRRALELIIDATNSLRPEPLHLTISVTPTFASKWLIPRLPEFVAAHPGIDLRIVASDRLANFQTDSVDLAVRYGRPPFGPGLTAELLFDQTIIAVASPLLVEKAGPFDQADRVRQVALLHDSHSLWTEYLERAFSGTAPPSSQNIRFNQTSLAVEAAVAGQGLALANRFLVEDDISSGRLVPILPVELRTGDDFYIVYPRKPRHPGPVAAVHQWLLKASSTGHEAR